MTFDHHMNVFDTKGTKRISDIEVRLLLSDADGYVNITDLVLQGGSIGTAWTAHPSEIRWSFEG